MKFTGHTILLTGGSSGIGLAFAAKFLELGNEVIITGRNAAKLDAAKAQFLGLHTIVGDVADSSGVVALADQVKVRFPKLDVLMNNAGILVNRNLSVPVADLGALTAEFATNVNGTIQMTSALIDVLTANNGTIINVSSGLAFVPLTSAPIYSATKAAIHSYTTSLRFQLEGRGVRVVELMPPAVKTDMTVGFSEGGAKLITTDELVAATIPALEAGDDEIRPGQSNQLHWMARFAPAFINRALFTNSKGLIPAVD